MKYALQNYYKVNYPFLSLIIIITKSKYRLIYYCMLLLIISLYDIIIGRYEKIVFLKNTYVFIGQYMDIWTALLPNTGISPKNCKSVRLYLFYFFFSPQS